MRMLTNVGRAQLEEGDKSVCSETLSSFVSSDLGRVHTHTQHHRLASQGPSLTLRDPPKPPPAFYTNARTDTPTKERHVAIHPHQQRKAILTQHAVIPSARSERNGPTSIENQECPVLLLAHDARLMCFASFEKRNSSNISCNQPTLKLRATVLVIEDL